MAVLEENPFKEILKPLKEVPPEMRKKVMADVAAAKLIIDMVTLITDNYPSSVKSTLKRTKREI